MIKEDDEYEAGANVTNRLRGDKPSGVVISVRLSEDDAERLNQLAEENSRSLSQVARQAIRAFLYQEIVATRISELEITYGSTDITAPIRATLPAMRQTFGAPVACTPA